MLVEALPLSPQRLREWYARRCNRAAGATGPAAGGASGAGAAGGAAGARGCWSCWSWREVLKAASDFFGEIFRETPAERPIDPKKKLGAEGKAILWADWTEKEVKKEVAELPNGKTPGGDGLPKELFEANWDVLGPELMRFIRDFEETAHLSESLTTAVTVLLHKKGDKGKLENYRPITLLSALYKIIVKGMANRIKRVLREVILDDQHGFVPGRKLADAV
ncbi:unnamed protein product [Closterium sp. NIES-53]